MLILQRQKGESIIIGDDIEVMVLRIGKKYIRLGITAPKEKMILRKELTSRSDKNEL